MYSYLIRNEDYILYVQVDNRLVLLDSPIQTHLNTLLKSELTNYRSREQTTKRLFKFKAKIPIYINKEILLMCIRSYRSITCLYINYFAIKSYELHKGYVVINYVDNHSMKLKDKHTFIKQLDKSIQIISHINQESVFNK